MKVPKNANTHWTAQQKAILRVLIGQNTPTRVMGIKLERTPEAVQAMANLLKLSTKPTNQSPYNRRKT